MDSLVEELEGLQRNTHIRRRLGTGELGDSLLYEGIFGHNKALINIMNDFPLLILELKSKTLEAVNLQEYWDKKNIVWSWSMNTEYVSNLLERDCPSPSERLSLASEVARNGGKLGFHIDPVCFYKGWKEDYTLLINDIFTQVPRQSILWISLGILRFPSFNHDYSEHLYPFISNEYIKGEDRKLRLLKPFRINIYKELAKMVFDQYPDCLLYLCMESGDVWDEALLERSKEIRHRLKNGIFS